MNSSNTRQEEQAELLRKAKLLPGVAEIQEIYESQRTVLDKSDHLKNVLSNNTISYYASGTNG